MGNEVSALRVVFRNSSSSQTRRMQSCFAGREDQSIGRESCVRLVSGFANTQYSIEEKTASDCVWNLNVERGGIIRH